MPGSKWWGEHTDTIQNWDVAKAPLETGQWKQETQGPFHGAARQPSAAGWVCWQHKPFTPKAPPFLEQPTSNGQPKSDVHRTKTLTQNFPSWQPLTSQLNAGADARQKSFGIIAGKDVGML